MTRKWAAGGALTAVYVAFALATGDRPLFDGFAPPAPYNWVKPPPELAAGNSQPRAAERTIPLTEQGSEAANASTTDAQVIVTLPQGAIPPHPPDTAVSLKLEPLDAGTLAPVPAELRVVSNAYRVTLQYQPSQAPVTQIAPSAIFAMTGASTSDTLLYSPDGQAWRETTARPFGNTHGLTGPVVGPGYYVATASPAVRAPITTAAPPRAGGNSGAAAVAVGVVGVGALGAAGWFLRDRRQRQREHERRAARAAARRRPPPKRRAPRRRRR